MHHCLQIHSHGALAMKLQIFSLIALFLPLQADNRDDAYAQRKQWYNSIARHEQAYPQWRTVCAHMARVTSDKRFTHTFFIPLLFHYLLISQPDICTRSGSGGGEIGSRS
uniref:Secreted protein n=1 Tax=Ascaris lumbricoides TaxID=6252 RepID=A0A0M3IWJ4_ASCLU